MRVHGLLLPVFLVLAWAGAAFADVEIIGLRMGTHPGFGRVVFDLPHGQAYTVATEADRFTIRFAGDPAVAAAGGSPRNVRGIVTHVGRVELDIATGAKVTSIRLGDRLVIDVYDPPAAGAPALITAKLPPAVATAPPPAAAVVTPFVRSRTDAEVSRAEQAAVPDPVPVPPPADAAPTQPRPAPPGPEPASSGDLGPVSIAATAVEGEQAIVLPFGPATSAAAFRRGNEGIAVFDERRPVDMSALNAGSGLAQATVALLPSGTVLRVPLGSHDVLSLERVTTGWRVGIAHREAAVTAAIRPTVSGGRLLLPVAMPGGVVSMPDPVTGRTLLVGVQKQAGQAIPVQRQMAEFALLPTWQGVAVAPLSDRLTMQPSPDAFILMAGPEGRLALGVQEGAALVAGDVSALSRRYDIPNLPRGDLLRRLQTAITTASSTPAQARAARRIQVAQAMIALGMGPEAQAVLALAGAEDGRAADDPDIIGLGAIAALISGRPAEAAGLLDPRLSGSDEIAFWRAVLAAQDSAGAGRAAPVFAATLKLPLAYPAPLQARLLPLVAETLVAGGERDAATALLAGNAEDAMLDLARGMLAESTEPKVALEYYDKIGGGNDRQARARALSRAVALRQATGTMDARQAADALERQLYAWRGDGQELVLRQRIAGLRADSGDARRALVLLRDTETLFPNSGADIRHTMVSYFARAIQGDGAASLAPLDLVALAEENGDLIPDGEAGQRLASTLADRLVALDLPRRAEPVLAKLIDGTSPGLARAELGGRLAAIQLAAGSAEAALQMLRDTANPGPLPPSLLEARTVTYARAAAQQGHIADGVAVLAQLNSDGALDERSALLEAAQDWPAAVAALRAWTDRVVPPRGQIDEAKALALLRLAAAAANAGDEATLAVLRERDTPRLPDGRTAEMFRLLTARPVHATADLARAGAEVKRARNAFEMKTAAR